MILWVFCDLCSMAHSCSVYHQMIINRAISRRRAVDPYALVRWWWSLWQAEIGVGSSPPAVPGCKHRGWAHTQHFGYEVVCELHSKWLLYGASAAKGFSLSLERALIKRELFFFLVRSVSDINTGKIISDSRNILTAQSNKNYLVIWSQ